MARRKKIKDDDYIKIEEKTKEEKVIEKKSPKKEVATKVEPLKEVPPKIELSKKIYKHPVVHGTLIFVLLVGLAYFLINLFYSEDYSVVNLISNLLLIVFTLLFVSSSIKVNRKNKTGIFVGSIILGIYFLFGIAVNVWNIDTTTLGTSITNFSSGKVINFTNMELTEVIKWSEKNKIEIIQDYEYSDMVKEYHIISQDIEVGSSLEGIKSIKVAISEGPNPAKEIIVPNMISWDSKRVLEFVKDNYLSNVDVSFVQSNNPVNTVIEQNKSGNMKRNEALNLVFSYGEAISDEEIKLRDLTSLSKFEAMFYLKQNHLNYEFNEAFSSKIKKDYVVTQSIKAGTIVKANDQKIVVSISKGPEIKIPNLKGMSMTEITEWVIKNKLKLEFTDKYDDSIEENSVISANFKEGEIIAQGTVVKVVISRGKLLMPEVNNYNEFKDWADKYGVLYEEKHEFSSSVNAGEAISYSYKPGDVIKNNETVTIVVSDGKEATVPNVVGASKNDASTKLKNAGFKYSFVYSYSSSVAQGKVIRQSIAAGSKVAQGITITVTISNGPKPASSKPSTPSQPATPTCDTSKGAVFWDMAGSTGTDTYSMTKNQNPGFTIIPTYVDSCPNGNTSSGTLCSLNVSAGSWVSYCTTVRMTIVR